MTKTGEDSKADMVEPGKDADEVFPSTRNPPGELEMSAKKRFPAAPKPGDMRHIATRDGYGFHMLDRISSDTFTAWCEFNSPDSDTLAQEVIDLNDRVGVKMAFKMAYKFAKLDGYSLIIFNYLDSAASIEDEPPEKVNDLLSLSIVTKDAVEKTEYDEDPTSPTFGNPTIYHIKLEVGTYKKTVKIPAGRVLHWTNWGMDTSKEGMSMFLPMLDDFLVKKNTDYALSEAVWKNAAALDILTLPENASKKAKVWAADNWKDINAMSEIAAPYGFDVKRLPGSAAMNPAIHVKWLTSKLASGSRLGWTVLTGDPAGKVTGSEFNYMDYYTYIASEQTEHIEFYMRLFYSIQYERGVIKSEGKLEIEWNPVKKKTDTEIAENNKLEADTSLSLSQALMNLNTAGYSLAVDENLLYIHIPGTQYGIRVNLDIHELAEIPEAALPEPILLMLQARNAWKVPKGDRMIIHREWEHPTAGPEADHLGPLMSASQKYSNSWMAKFEKVWADTMTNAEDGKNTVPELTKKILSLQGNAADIERVLDSMLEDAYSTELEFLAEKMGIDMELFRPGLPDARDWFESKMLTVKDGITSKLNAQFREAISKGLAQGHGYKQINEALKGVSKQFQKGIPATVHKVVHESMMKSRADTLEKEGEKRVDWLTVGDDLVRDEHAALESSNPHDIREVRPWLSDYGCRCCIVPLTYLEKRLGPTSANPELMEEV